MCAHADCQEASVGKSRYCRTHRAEHRAAWIAKVSADKIRRNARNARYESVLAEADYASGHAGLEASAALASRPHPIAVRNALNGQVVDTLPDCYGSATVVLSPGTHALCRYLRATFPRQYSRHYYGGTSRYFAIEYQSVAEAKAEAWASVIRDARFDGLTVSVSTRLD